MDLIEKHHGQFNTKPYPYVSDADPSLLKLHQA
jgi:hypothetical protein